MGGRNSNKRGIQPTVQGRNLVIGDIHGASKALEQVLERSGADLDRDRLIFLGDYVDGWSGSAEIILKLMDIRERTAGRQNEAVFLIGNHDAWYLNWLENGKKPEVWVSQGGKATILSLEKHFAAFPEDKQRFTEFFRQMRFYYIDEQNRCFVHGGFTSKQGCEKEINLTDCYWDRTLVYHAVEFCEDNGLVMDSAGSGQGELIRSGMKLPARLKLYKEIYIGHTPSEHFGSEGPLNAANLWMVDTAAGWRGRLTIMDVETKEYWQSDSVAVLYKDELHLGRGNW